MSDNRAARANGADNSLPLEEGAPIEGLRLLPLAQIHAPEGFNARKDYGEQSGSFEQLVSSILERGVLQPILVRPNDSGTFEVVAGFRRFSAAQHCKLETIPALVRNSTQGTARLDNLVENLLRDDLNCIEEAEGMAATLVGPPSMEQEALGLKFGRSQSYISHSLKLLTLPSVSLSLLRERALTRSHGQELARLAVAGFGATEIDQVATHAHSESLTVAALSARIASKIDAKAKADSTPPLFQEPAKPAPAASHAASHTAEAPSSKSETKPGYTPEDAKKEFEEAGGPVKPAGETAALDAAREKAAEAKPAAQPFVVPTERKPQVAMIYEDQQEFLAGAGLTVFDALDRLREISPSFEALVALKKLNGYFNDQRPGETPYTLAETLDAIILIAVQKRGLTDSLESSNE